MSHSILLKVEKTGKAFEDLEMKDAKGMQPLVWSLISQKILEDKKLWISDIKYARMVWDYWTDPDCSEAEAFAILCTFDKALIEGHMFKKAANKLKRFFIEHKVPSSEPNVFPEIIEYLEKNLDESCLGVCFHHNTLSSSPWDKEDGTYYNFLTDKEHFGVFASLKNRKELVLPEEFSKAKFTKEKQNG